MSASSDFVSPLPVASRTDHSSIELRDRHEVDSPLPDKERSGGDFSFEDKEADGVPSAGEPKQYVAPGLAHSGTAILDCCGVSRNDDQGPAGCAYVLGTGLGRKRSIDLFLGLNVSADVAAYNSLLCGLNSAVSAGVKSLLVQTDNEHVALQMSGGDSEVAPKVLKLHSKCTQLIKANGMRAEFRLTAAADMEETSKMARKVVDRYAGKA